MTKFAVAAGYFCKVGRQRLHRLVLRLVRQGFRREREGVIERHRSESAGDLASRGADGTPHGHHRGATYHRAGETDRSPKVVLIVAERDMIDSDVALFSAGARDNSCAARQIGGKNAAGERSCVLHKIAPCDLRDHGVCSQWMSAKTNSTRSAKSWFVTLAPAPRPATSCASPVTVPPC